MNRIGRVAAVALPLLLFAACENAPVAPQTRPQYSAEDNADLTKVAKFRIALPNDLSFASQLIGPTGGSISLAGFSVDVPAGAVTQTTLFTITLPTNGRALKSVLASFGPHGTTFNVPVTLTLPFAGTSAEGGTGIHVLWFDGSGWVALPTDRTSDGRIQTRTTHFSDYGTEEQDSTGRGVTLSN
jgi:hypothetical protein